MNYSVSLLLLFLMIAFSEAEAQKTKVDKLQWHIAGSLPATNGKAALGVAGPVAGVHNGVLLVGGGANFPGAMPWAGGKKMYHNEVYAYRRQGDSLVHFKTVQLPFSLAYAAACTTPQGIAVAGGENEQGLSDKVYLLQWDATISDVTVSALPALPFAFTNATAVYHNGALYVAGGERSSDVSNSFLRLNLNDTGAGWIAMPPLPLPVSHAVLVVQSECLYLIGGRKRNLNDTSTLYSSVWQFSWDSKSWAQKAALPYALSAGTGVAYGSRYIVMMGGDAGETFHKAESLIAQINQTPDEARKKVLNDEKAVVQSTHPGFCRQVLLYDTRKNKWRQLSRLPFETPVTTTAVLWGNACYIPSGEVKAGIRSPYILSFKMVR